jgi:HSP20 family molecular chaperone IbpA
MDRVASLSNFIHPQHTNLADSSSSNRPMHIIGQLINDPWFTIDELRHRYKAAGEQGDHPSFAPNFDVRESADYYFLEGEFPGVANKNDIHIEWVGRRTLVIEVRVARLDEEAEWGISLKPTEYMSENEDGGSHRHERRNLKLREWLNDRHTGELQRSFTFPHDVDTENLKARLSNGLLKILATKLRGNEREPRKRIEIED